ncbi:hypothetical protein MASR2M117_12330 [Paludibacter sp.]
MYKEPVKILAIDDNNDNLITIKALIHERFSKATIITAQDGKSGIELAVENNPDVILLDIIMPMMDGYEVCKRLKKHPITQDIPVVFLTAIREDVYSRIKALESGGDGFLTKPVDSSELTTQVNSMVKIRKATLYKKGEQERLERLIDERTKELQKSNEETLRVLRHLQEENERRKKSEEQLKLFKQAVDSSKNSIIITDSKGCVLYVNPCYTESTGRTFEMMSGKPLRSFDLPENNLDYNEIWETAMKGSQWSKELLASRVNGEKYWGKSFIYPIFSNKGEFTNFVMVGEDISEKKKLLDDLIAAKNKAEENEKKYKTIANESPNGVILVDLQGRIKEISDLGALLLGASSKESLIGETVLKFVDEVSLQTVRTIVQNTTSDGFTQDNELTLVKQNNERFLGDVSTTLIQNNDGAPTSFIIVVRDISHQKKSQAMQIHADRMANLGEMAAGMAHEINQPLNIISMVMDKMIYDSEKINVVDKDYLTEKANKVFDNLTRIRNIIDHIRVFSRYQLDYIPIDFNLNKSIENAAFLFNEQFKHLDISFKLKLQDDLPEINGNIYQFEQVIINLLSNAKDAVMEKKNMNNQDYLPKICIFSQTTNDKIIIEVADNGIGIDEKDIKNLMLPFYSTKDEGKGTGLGLSISYKIIHEMGGFFDITSIKMKETRVKIIFNITNKLNGK